jgi:hypothetical protein
VAAGAASNYAECLLDRMPGTQNAAVAQTVVKQCVASHPAGYLGVTRGSGKGWFSYSDPDACVLAKAKATTNAMAADMIRGACHCLYGDRLVGAGPTCADHLNRP